MAKTLRRPVDKLERKQRLEQRRNQDQNQPRLAPQNWDVFLDSYDEDINETEAA